MYTCALTQCHYVHVCINTMTLFVTQEARSRPVISSNLISFFLRMWGVLLPYKIFTNKYLKHIITFLHNAVSFLLGNSPASAFHMPTVRNTLSVPSSQAGRYEEWLGLRMLEYLYGKRFGSKIAWANNIQMPGNYPEESTQHSVHSESLKSRISAQAAATAQVIEIF